ncbi:MAG: ATP-dependent DNA ligase [Candidatus Levybacteria bacterium]|nr:ATP-dependent DNA ligase [Candidatus Levybacteria bacterium]
MTFQALSLFFQKLESTSSRLTLIDILSDLFKASDASEIDKIVYLTQGRIAPFFEAVEIGMAEKQVAGALAASLNIKREEVLKLYGKLGDMGAVAEQLNSKLNPSASLRARTQNSKLVVGEVFAVLKQIADTKGEGTVEKRQTLLSNLLKKLNSLSSKYLVRIPLGNLRLGIGDPTILDGLAKAALNAAGAKLDRVIARKPLEGAYNRTSDLGLIAKTLWEKGLDAVSSLKVIVGKPIRSERCERLPSAEKAIEKMGTVDAQPKYDGFRVQIHKDGTKISMFSRNLENMTQMFPELIEGTLKQVKARSAILDTEALAYNTESEEFLPFQETTKRRRKYNIEELAKSLPLKAFVFDLLYKDGESLIDKPLVERLEILDRTIKEDGVLTKARTRTVSDPKTLNIILQDYISKGLEGIVVKKLESSYEAGARNFNWVKLKRHANGELNDTIDCVILGYVFGKGKRTAFGAGALLVGVYDDKRDEFVTVSKIGTGLSDEEWKEIHKRADKIKVDHKPARVNSLITPSVWIKPEIVIEVLADEITRSPIHTAGSIVTKSGDKEPGYALRFPRLVSFRTSDKKPEDATTVSELISMYRQQNKK